MALAYGAHRAGQGREDAALGQRVLGSLTQVDVLSVFSLGLVEPSGTACVKMSSTAGLTV